MLVAAPSGYHGHPQTVDLLVDHGTDIDAVTKGRTPLEWASFFENGALRATGVECWTSRGQPGRGGEPGTALRIHAWQQDLCRST
ncbi:ankyrin repeat domain-containing protein [Streptomyces sp. NPDC012637]|uniref:ankyrin repeat domain-containing protein n=1 Tax=Streptomyces sp. NPDC012637 TaxID=3364842 RepID=UPI0036EEB048